MFDTDNIITVNVSLLEGQIDLILRALELYAFNLHHTWGVEVDEDLHELRNALLFHTYEGLTSVKTNFNYRQAYDVTGNCRRELGKKKKLLY